MMGKQLRYLEIAQTIKTGPLLPINSTYVTPAFLLKTSTTLVVFPSLFIAFRCLSSRAMVRYVSSLHVLSKSYKLLNVRV